MNPTLKIRPEAEADIAAAYDWYEAEYPGLGAHFFSALNDAFDLIINSPLHYALVKTKVRRKLLKGFPCAVFFVFEDNEVRVLGVVQQSRNPSVWQSRR